MDYLYHQGTFSFSLDKPESSRLLKYGLSVEFF